MRHCNLTLDSKPAGVVIRWVRDRHIEKRDTTGGRSLSPMERLNQDTSFSPIELNNLLNAMSTLPSISSYPMVTPAVTKPRQDVFELKYSFTRDDLILC